MLLELDSINGCGATPPATCSPRVPASFVRSIAGDRTGSVDTTPLWRKWIAQGWTELTEPAEPSSSAS